MSDLPESTGPDSPRQPEPEWVRRRRLAAVFGDVLPESTSDDRDPAGADGASGDRWLEEQVPPHHG